MKSPETKRRHRGPGFHKNRLWQHAVVNDDNGQSLGPFGLHNLKQGPNRAMGCHRRHSFSSGHTTSLKRVRTSDASEVCFRLSSFATKLIGLTALPSALPGNCPIS